MSIMLLPEQTQLITTTKGLGERPQIQLSLTNLKQQKRFMGFPKKLHWF